MRRALVIGARGQIGFYLHRSLEDAGVEVVGTRFDTPDGGMLRLDIRDSNAVNTTVEAVRPDVVFLPAAIANVDRCERDPVTARQTNVLGTRNVCLAARAARARIVFFSTDYVFDGAAGPYDEDDPPNPLSAYGLQKLIGEHVVVSSSPTALVVRTTVVYGWEPRGRNFIQRLVRSLRAGERVRVPFDQIGSPTWSRNLGEAVVELASKEVRGVFHVTGPEVVSRYDFAMEAARAFDLDSSLLDAVSTASLGQAARRPLQAGMRVDKAQKVLRTSLLGFREGLLRMAAEEREWLGA